MSDLGGRLCYNLSANDERVLRRIFSADLTLTGDCEQEQELNGHDDNVNGVLEEVVSADTVEARRLELLAVQSAAEGDLETALQLLDDSIQLAPEHPSSYNNRAQTFRLLNNTAGAMADLDKAIQLSGGAGPAACQAFTQRALLRRLQNDEVGAVDDFKMAARLGSRFAKTQLTQLNPYTALCGAAVREMMRASLQPVVFTTTGQTVRSPPES